jgi:ketosteroid isomerase-like protein
MAEVFISNIERDGERRTFRDHGGARLGAAGGVSVLEATFEPGWRWSEDVAPIAGTASCQVRHLGYVMSGRMGIVMDDGAQLEIGPGDLFDCAPGHDAWTIGDEACVVLDISPEATRYATKAAAAAEPDTAIELVRRGYAAFNTGDVDTLMGLFSLDVVQHVPGNGPFAGTYKGPEAVLGYYGKIAEVTGGTFRAHLVDLHGDGAGHVMAQHLISAERNGEKRVSRGSILFTFIGEKATDLLELHGDLAGDDAFFSD